MGNLRSKNLEYCEYCDSDESMSGFTPVDEFEFLGPFEDSNNGLFLNGTYMPEEVLTKILSYVPPKELLSLTLVCKKWCNIIKSDSLWIDIYNNEFPHKAKKLPWYIYYSYYTTNNFKNLLKNGNGQEQFRHWSIVKNFGDQFKIEDPPVGTLPLPEGVPDFNGHTSCFVTSYYECNKFQAIHLEEKRLLRYIMNRFRPSIYVSEWANGRFDCGSKYTLAFKGLAVDQKVQDDIDSEDEESYNDSVLMEQRRLLNLERISDREWEKVEFTIEKYPENVMTFVFEHEGVDTQFWKGHYGSKMAGGVVKLLLESIKPEKVEDCESQTSL